MKNKGQYYDMYILPPDSPFKQWIIKQRFSPELEYHVENVHMILKPQLLIDATNNLKSQSFYFVDPCPYKIFQQRQKFT